VVDKVEIGNAHGRSFVAAMTRDWQPIRYTTPGMWLPFQLCRRVGNRRYRVTLPIWRRITLEDIDLCDWWRPC
jgi:hypothetical protein